MTKRCWSSNRCNSVVGPVQPLPYLLALLISFVMITPLLWSDETHERYFDQLRQRGLFPLAEAEAISRLAGDDLSLAAKSGFTIELSKTLTEHAGFVADEQREELWNQAQNVVQDLLDQDRMNPRTILLSGQLASVFVAKGDWLRAEWELWPFNEPLVKQANHACSNAIEQLLAIEKLIAEPNPDSVTRRTRIGAPTAHELRLLLHRVRWQLGLSFRNRAELALPGSAQRSTDIANAEQELKKLIGAADEPLQSRSKILMVACSRLKGNLDRASALLVALEKAEPNQTELISDEIVVEKAHLLLEQKLPTEAAELLMKTRSKRQRLTGEMWLLQTRALIGLREISLDKQQQTLANQLREQIGITIARCEEQVGGYWGRRCRQYWDNAQTSLKYGPELDELMQRARMDFTAGRVDQALAEYAAAEKAAVKKDQLDLAIELGFTRASILLDQKQFELASSEFLRIANDFPAHARAAKSHLLATYCLGRIYDEKKTQSRREAYTEALDYHLANYARDPTINEVFFLKAQLEEQRLQATQALPLYLKVDASHAKSTEAMSGAARCYETILRRMNERHLPLESVQDEAIDRLSKYLTAAGASTEFSSMTQADIALRLVAILLMESEGGEMVGSVSHNNQTAKTDDPRVDRVKPSNLNRCIDAERWLGMVTTLLDARDSEPSFAAANESLRQRMVPLRIVALAGTGNYTDAAKTLNSLTASPVVLLSIVERLLRIVATTNPSERVRLASLQINAAEKLIPLREELSVDAKERLDGCLVRVYLGAGQFAKAAEVVKRLSDASAKDVNKQREIAQLLASVKDREAYQLAKQCWRRVESLSNPGSSEWMTARLGVLETSFRLHQFDEARKLMQLTKVLYPELGGNSLSARFEAIERELQAAATPPR